MAYSMPNLRSVKRLAGRPQPDPRSRHAACTPESVRQHLPAHAQDIYKEAFNSAWDEYGNDESRAHRVAWGAVERKYHKDPSGKWVEGPTQDKAHR